MTALSCLALGFGFAVAVGLLVFAGVVIGWIIRPSASTSPAGTVESPAAASGRSSLTALGERRLESPRPGCQRPVPLEDRVPRARRRRLFFFPWRIETLLGTRLTKLGRYEVLSELGKGAMGVVYLAKDPVIGRLVAIKTIRASTMGDDDSESREFRERFVREAQTAGILSHPNIVTIHDIGEDPDTQTSFIAMEYIEGKNLKVLLTEKTQFTWDQIADMIAAGRRGARLRPPQGDHPPRHQAGQHHHHDRRQGEDHRLRDREDRLLQPDDDRPVSRHAQLHVARAGLRARRSTGAATSSRSASSSTSS